VRPYSPLDAPLEQLNRLEIRLNTLKNDWPSGIRSIDDEIARKIIELSRSIDELRLKVARLRAAQ
jgi:hypothetical protein